MKRCLQSLPPDGINLDTAPTLKALASANRVLGELVGRTDRREPAAHRFGQKIHGALRAEQDNPAH